MQDEVQKLPNKFNDLDSLDNNGVIQTEENMGNYNFSYFGSAKSNIGCIKSSVKDVRNPFFNGKYIHSPID